VTGTPILWLVGALGSGKSDTSYHVFSRLWREGVRVARLDLDDVGMCHPTPADDPDNHRVKARAMVAAWSVFREHGASCLVLSGGVNVAEEVELHVSRIPEGRWTICRLRIGAEERHRRLARRAQLLGQDEQYAIDQTRASAADELVLDAQTFPDEVVDIDGLDQYAVVDLVLTRTRWPSGRTIRPTPS
jgi:hypothetical protein